MTVDKSKRPYYDDYKEEKNFHEILFRPRFAVQTRELNQIQTMFHEQVGRLGDHMFKEGSVVIPGETNYDLELSYVTLNISNYNNVSPQLLDDEIYIRSVNGLKANVKLVAYPTDTDPATLYLEYVDSSSVNDQLMFEAGNNVTIYRRSDDVMIAPASVIGAGIGSKFTVNTGVYYIGRRFVLVPKQTVLLDKYSNTPSKIVCVEYTESVVTENEDSSLFDNAQGSPNFTAPGAHRLRVDTTLRVFDLDELDTLPENVVEIFRIKNGEIQKKKSGPDYNILNDAMAKRTYEESGNYTVDSFSVRMDEHVDVAPEGEGDPDKFAVILGAGLAYVSGYRIETLAPTTVEVDKARATSIRNNSSISVVLGHYIEVTDLNIIPDVNQLQEISFYNDALTSAGNVPAGSVIGTARVRFVRKDGANYRLYLFDARNVNGNRSSAFIGDAVSIHSTIGQPITATLVTSELYDAASSSLMFPMNVEFVKTLRDANGVSDTSFSSVKQYDMVCDTSGRVTITAASNEVFVGQDPTYAYASFIGTAGVVDASTISSISGNPMGSVITVDFGVANAGRSVRLNLQVAKREVVQKTKTIETGTVSVNAQSATMSLHKADAIKIVSVTDAEDNDVTGLYSLHVNKTKNYYGVSHISGGGPDVVYPVAVVFEYFAHSAGDYFGPDSYADFDYVSIPSEGGIRLSDVLDFRPRMGDDGSFSGVGSTVGSIPTPYSILRADIEHYLPRIDKVYINSKGEFGVVQGVPELDPKEPENPNQSMVVYVLEVPPYTFDPSDVQAKMNNNRRYTMKDIGYLEERLSNVEYYVSLNLLESEAESKQIVDPQTGMNRFKNGFLTDAFDNHSIGDFAWQHYHVSMSTENSEMHPEFSMNAVDLEINEDDSSSIVNNRGIVTLPYTHSSFVNQNQRSDTINVNPYAVFRWDGSISLTPESDSWIDTEYTNPSVTYRVFNNGRLTQQWNSWQLNWTGGSSSSSSTSRRTSASHSEWQAPTAAGEGVWNTGNWANGGWRRSTRTTTRRTTVRTNVNVVGDRVVDTSVIPFMRTIEIEIDGTGNRPNCKMNFFFDDVKINQYIRPENGSYGHRVETDDEGDFKATFKIPNSSDQRFRVGEKLMVVTDEPEMVRERSTSWAEASFTSSGTHQVRQRSIVATRSRRTTTRTRVRWHDPLAQSFLVEREGGVFMTKVNVFLSTKDPIVPIQVQIREMENGMPTQRQVPGAIRVLHPSQVNLSEDGSVPTTFEFDYPVYLMDGAEYCIVVMSNSNLYNAHIATMGQRDKESNQWIVEQPYAGILFKSLNNSTWTADQMSTMQFELFHAQFQTNTTGILMLDNKEPAEIMLRQNPIETTASSNTVTIHKKQHNMIVGTNVMISGATGGNGITDLTVLNRRHTVTSIVSPDAFRVALTATATDSGFVGGDAILMSNTVQASLLHPNITDVMHDGTNIVYQVRGTSGKSIDGTEVPYRRESAFTTLTNKENNFLSYPWVITHREDEKRKLNGERSLRTRVMLHTTNPNVSPVIDVEGASVITPCSLVTSPTTHNPDGTNNYANYRTRVTPLKNPARSLRVYVDIDKPEGSEVLLSARFGNSEEELIDSEWQFLDAINTQISGDGDGFLENEYGLEALPDYTMFQVMIQLKATSCVRYPICQRLRALALGT